MHVSKENIVLLAASILAMVLGSVHAFSVFILPLEAAFGTSRSLISLTYSLALVFLTLAVLWGHYIYTRWRPSTFVILICLLGAIGALIAGYAQNIETIWLGYGVCFGIANGLGYGFGLQMTAQAGKGREGTFIGIVTAAYALGAAISPMIFTTLIELGGFKFAMFGLITILLTCGIFCAAILHKSNFKYKSSATQTNPYIMSKKSLIFLWVAYGAGVAGGLMAIGHAASIAYSLNSSGADWVAPAVIAIFNLIGA